MFALSKQEFPANPHFPGATEMASGEVDKQWFLERFADKRLSLRGVAKLIEMSPSSLSLRLDGTYKISMEEAKDLARLLGATFDEVVRRAGIDIPKISGKPVKVVGTVGPDGRIKAMGKGQMESVDRPAGLQGDIEAVRGPEGWLYFYSPTSRFEPDAVGRLSVWAPSDTPSASEKGGGGHPKGGYLGVLKRGSERGLWDVAPLFMGVATPLLATKTPSKAKNTPLESGVRGVKGGSATPVLMILP